MSASQSGVFNLQQFTDLGAPLVGGRLYTYEYGTTTQKTAYTDHAGLVPHTYTSDGLGGQYIALNSRGELPAPLYLSGGSYDLALKTSAGATVWTRRADPVWDIANDLSTSSGASLLGFIQSGYGAVARSAQDKMRESVSVEDFGAVCDGVTDDSASVQLAVNYCILNNIDLEVPGLCKLTMTINIDRPFAAFANPNFFTIFSRRGGGFVCSTAITMFGTSITYGSDPVSHMIRFQDIRFVGGAAYNTTASYVMSSALFRVVFQGCSFVAIKCLNTAKYTQSIHFYNCNVRGFNGIFFYGSLINYDLKVIGGFYEDSYGDLWNIGSPTGVSFIGALMEGLKTNGTQLGTPITYSVAQGLDIQGCYIEGNNGFDIDGSVGTSHGVNLSGNFIDHSLRSAPNLVPGRWYQIQSVSLGTNWAALGAASATIGVIFQCNNVAQTGTDSAYEFSVRWGTCTGCVSEGNFHTQAMHSLQSDSEVIVNDYSQASVVNISLPFIRKGVGTLQLCTYLSQRTDSGGYQWTFGEGAGGVLAKHFGITCDSNSGTPFFDINGQYGNIGIGMANPDAANQGVTLFMKKTGATAPTTSTSGGYIYVSSDGSLKYVSPGGTLTQLAPN